MKTRTFVILAILTAAAVLASFFVAAGQQKIHQRPSAEDVK